MDSVKDALQVLTVGFEEKYLGLPTPDGRMTKGKFQNLQVKLTKRLFSFDGHPTQAGKEVLIKSVAQEIPNYLMSVFKLPFEVCDDLNHMVRNYFWGAEKGKRKTHWYAWNKMTRPKCQGGLGFRDFRLFNQALLARQAWRLLTHPDGLCARLLKAKYYPNGRLEDTVFTGNPSPTWQAICHGLELLKKGMVWRIANGQNVRIWRDRWIVRDPTGGLISPKGRCRFKWVSELMDHNGNWDNSKLQQFFLPINICEIQKIRPSHRLGEDFIAWAQEKSGVFSVRSAYRLASDDLHNGPVTSSSHHPDSRRDGWKALWSCSAPPKVFSFGWRLANNSLDTWCKKNKRKLEPSALCPICNTCEEDSFHTLCSCINARTL